ncbi:MAG: flagellar protein FlgN [Proteobacteria bacterium]|nr:flagellar protein FlgN [Pseudomonadota bacterium]MBU1687471.1 flagellar protein FlgN [Pseudomonadota bacterium]
MDDYQRETGLNQNGGRPEETQEETMARVFEWLKREVALCREMVELLNAERAALVAMDMEKLIGFSITKKNLAIRISRLDEGLQEVAQKLAGEAEGQVVKLACLEPMVSPDEVDRLRQFRSTLAELRFEIGDRNLVNRRFAEETLGYIGDAIRMITGAIADHTSYEGRGGMRKTALAAKMISTEV